ncbi:ATP-binding protein [Dokdonia sp.]|uniref:sensor histidine kinase n=1 Tax=Dokdonia sp. TaxID=2024995 RepID=UPI003267031F
MSRYIIYCLIFIIVILLFLIQRSYLKRKEKLKIIKEIYQTERRISKKVHDEISNDIYTIMYKLQNIENSSNNFSGLLEGLEDLYAKTRDISREYSTYNTKIKFKEQIIDIICSIINTKKIKIITKIPDLENTEIEPHIKINIYRIIQELMINVSKHSNATILTIMITYKDKNLKIQVHDNGLGFNSEKQSKGIGLINIENRVKNLNGQIMIDSIKGIETSTLINIPIKI